MPVVTQLPAYSFNSARITLDTITYVAISNITSSQPTEEGEAGMGTSPYPLTFDQGTLGRGSAEITWSDLGERNSFIDHLARIGDRAGVGYRDVVFPVVYILSARGRPDQVIELTQARVLDEPDEAGSGTPIGGTMTLAFAQKLINGRAAH